MTDLKAGGKFEVIAEGAFAVAAADTTSLSASKVAYRSNTLAITVDGAAAAKVAPAIKTLEDRTIETSCSGTRGTTLTNALARTVQLSNAAANAAQSGSAAKFQEYFKTTTTSARNTVAARFRGVAAQAGSTNSGSTRYYCTDPYGYCDPNVLAYSEPFTLPYNSLMSLLTHPPSPPLPKPHRQLPNLLLRPSAPDLHLPRSRPDYHLAA